MIQVPLGGVRTSMKTQPALRGGSPEMEKGEEKTPSTTREAVAADMGNEL